ncbi:MAG: SUF system NifU family Fe-S cluster assembly protein [Bacilli bacterium]|nr:SUF system NifU family Fe-S cluster assembly protein [Bacilli bacterium]
MDQQFRRDIILENYQNPMNKGLINDDSYIKVNTNNESCIDEIDLMVKIKDGKIIDARFDGEACAICTSSTSIMIKMLIGKTLEEAIKIYKNFNKMINEEEYDEEILEEANVYNDTYKQPNRKKCVLLPWWGFEKVINEVKER